MKHERVQVRYYDHTSRNEPPLKPIILTEIGFVHSDGITGDGHAFLVLSVGYDEDDDYDNPCIVVMLDDLVSIQRLRSWGPEMSWGEFNR